MRRRPHCTSQDSRCRPDIPCISHPSVSTPTTTWRGPGEPCCLMRWVWFVLNLLSPKSNHQHSLTWLVVNPFGRVLISCASLLSLNDMKLELELNNQLDVFWASVHPSFFGAKSKGIVCSFFCFKPRMMLRCCTMSEQCFCFPGWNPPCAAYAETERRMHSLRVHLQLRKKTLPQENKWWKESATFCRLTSLKRLFSLKCACSFVVTLACANMWSFWHQVETGVF